MSSRKGPLSRRQYVVGLTVTLIGSLLFYTWLLYAVFKVPVKWVAMVMSQVAVAETLIGIYGYRVWRTRNNQSVTARVEPVVRPIEIAGFMVALAIPTAGSIYLVWRGFHSVALVTGLVAVVVAFYGVKNLRSFHQFPHAPMVGSQSAVVPPPVQMFWNFMIAFAVAVPLAVGVTLLVQGDVVIALVLLALSAAMLPSAIRRIKSSDQSPR